LGVLATALASGMHHWYIILANIGCVALLWFYSTSFKRRLLIGNIVISLLTAWTVLILFFLFTEPRNAIGAAGTHTVKFFRIAFLYGGFAFIITLIREAVKDMEDMEGDARYGCRTLPIVAGIRTTKVYTMVWIVVLFAALVIVQLYVLQFGWWLAVLFSSICVIVPLAMVALQLSRAKGVQDFASISSLIKWVTLTGIVSMIFFRIYF
jgi:4-hydroxybenzoate polyprenyltransferase